MKLVNYVKALAPSLLLFVLITSLSVGAGGTVVFHLPTLAVLIAHADVYGPGLLLLLEAGLRIAPTEEDASLLTALSKFLDVVIPNRAALGGVFGTDSPIQEIFPSIRGAAV